MELTPAEVIWIEANDSLREKFYTLCIMDTVDMEDEIQDVGETELTVMPCGPGVGEFDDIPMIETQNAMNDMPKWMQARCYAAGSYPTTEDDYKADLRRYLLRRLRRDIWVMIIQGRLDAREEAKKIKNANLVGNYL